MLVRFILFTLAFYIIYKVVFNVIVPIFRTTRTIHRQFSDMQQKMQDQMNSQANGYQQYPGNPSNQEQKTNQKTPAGDYIDFEEVKD
ncbi:MAG: hypothetical protein QM726_02575 [Chitinophagaceae bacterium]